MSARAHDGDSSMRPGDGIVMETVFLNLASAKLIVYFASRRAAAWRGMRSWPRVAGFITLVHGMSCLKPWRVKSVIINGPVTAMCAK